MAKKAFGKLAALLTIAGAAAAGISYLTKYRSFNKELDEDFHDFEDEDETEVPDSTMSRNYVSLHADKDEFLVAAGDMMNAAKNMVKDAAAIVADNTREAVSVARDGAQKAAASAEDTVEKAESAAEDAVIKTADAMESAVETVSDTMEETAAKLEAAADQAEEITVDEEPAEKQPVSGEEVSATTVSEDTEA